ncbi:adenylate cyclase type 9 [Alosa alosa]|uniref:adenylate cyclase type 9 n=1 Tax=Alosa alosa TaxID=278164 RepID=UPI0020152063|nr:adenylate cyclase type 9 [Alosa alosa]
MASPQHQQLLRHNTEVSCESSGDGSVAVRISGNSPLKQQQHGHDTSVKQLSTGTGKTGGSKPCKNSISSSDSSGESGMPRAIMTSLRSHRKVPQLFERSAAQCWDPKFDSAILEEACRERCFPQAQRRFRYVLFYLATAAVLWCVYFGVNARRCDPASFLVPAASFLLFCLLLFLFTFTRPYTLLYNQASLLLITVTFGITLALQLQTSDFASLRRLTERNVTGGDSSAAAAAAASSSPLPPPCVSTVGTFSLGMEVLLLLYSMLHLRLYASVLLGLLYSVLFEALGWLHLAPPSGDELGDEGLLRAEALENLWWLVPAKVLLHLCAHLIGIHLFIMSEVRSRSTFLKVGQAIMHGKDLEVEKALKERMIHSVMPRRVADELMKQGDEESESSGKRYSSGNAGGAGSGGGGGPGGSSSSGAGGATSSSPKSHKRKKTSIPRSQFIFRPFNMKRMEPVSILFADIVGFTRMSANKSAPALVGLLNDLFGRFDRLCELTRCEKISTLGDCYYCVAGCPEPQPDHAYCCVEMGLGMITAIEQFCQETKETVDMRVGVHTGTVLCGILGMERFKFDVWSNDVNLANLMEQLGVAGKVHLSEATAGFLDDRYEQEDGRVTARMGQNFVAEQLKGMRTYLISGRKSDPSQALLSPSPRAHTPDPAATGPAAAAATTTTTAAAEPRSHSPTNQFTGSPRVPDACITANTVHNTIVHGACLFNQPSGQPLRCLREYEAVNGGEGRRETVLDQPACLHVRSHTLTPPHSLLHTLIMSTISPPSLSFTFICLVCVCVCVCVCVPTLHCGGDPQGQQTGAEGATQNGGQEEHRPNSSKFPAGRSPKALNGLLGPLTEEAVTASQTSLCEMLQEKDKKWRGGGRGMGGMDHSALIPLRSKNFRERSDVHFVDVIKEDSLMKDYFFKPPINKVSLNFLESSLESAYRSSYQEEVETHAPAQTFASPTFSSFLDVLLSCAVFLALTLACFLYPLVTAKTPPATTLGMAASAALLEIISLVLSIRMTFYLDNVLSCTQQFLRVVSGWVPRHIIGALLVSLPAMSVFSHLTYCLHLPKEVIMLLCCAIIIAIIQYCNFCQLSFWMRSALATAAGVALLALLYSPLSRPSANDIYLDMRNVSRNISVLDFQPSPTPVSDLGTQKGILQSLVPEAILAFFLLLLLVWFLNREFEVSYRLHYHGNVEADKHRIKIQNMRNQADLLLRNIIPIHVAEQLKVTQSYSKNHDNVGVIFGSIVNFSEFYEESYEGGKECYRVLNELIGDFDELLRRPVFASVEKIKTIGATYMAASGLNGLPSTHATPHHLRALFDFALEMMHVVDDFNKNMLGFKFKLRIGFNHGPLTAGVIGTTKLLYDIWGDTVNIASRMDTTGMESRVQVSEESHCVLRSLGYSFDYRGTVNVKGKGQMRTYLFPKLGDGSGDSGGGPGGGGGGGGSGGGSGSGILSHHRLPVTEIHAKAEGDVRQPTVGETSSKVPSVGGPSHSSPSPAVLATQATAPLCCSSTPSSSTSSSAMQGALGVPLGPILGPSDIARETTKDNKNALTTPKLAGGDISRDPCASSVPSFANVPSQHSIEQHFPSSCLKGPYRQRDEEEEDEEANEHTKLRAKECL